MGETTDEFITAGWLYAKPMAWMGRKAYHGAQRAGIAWQNWRWGGSGEEDPPTPATASGGSGKGGNWTSEVIEESTSFEYHHTSRTERSR